MSFGPADLAKAKALGVRPIERRFASIAALALEDASKYPPGTLVHVGPDAYQQYSEWYSNGVRWRPRGGILYTQNTPASLPDTTTTETDVWSYTIPNQLIGPNDVITADWFWSYTNSAATKGFRLYFGTATWMSLNSAAGAGFRGRSHACMRNSKTVEMWASAIHGVAFADGSGSSGGAQVSNVNTNNDVVVRAAAAWGTAAGGTSNITLERISLKIEFVA